MKPFLLYIDIALIIDDRNRAMEPNSVRHGQIVDGIRRLCEYNWVSHGCDVLITDNTCPNLPVDITSVLPSGTIQRCFVDNRFGAINKGAGLIQKWEYNRDILAGYEWIIHFEGRLLLQNFSYFDRFFADPAPYFVYGSKTPGDTSHYFTGVFTAPATDILRFCELHPKEHLIRHSISIEYPIKEFFAIKARVIDEIGVLWHCARNTDIQY